MQGHGLTQAIARVNRVFRDKPGSLVVAEKSDLFDVLAHVAYALPPVLRAVRADHARVHVNSHFNAKQQAFLDFVLSHYISVGVEELNQDKLKPLSLMIWGLAPGKLSRPRWRTISASASVMEMRRSQATT
jgi:hypothetical protein